MTIPVATDPISLYRAMARVRAFELLLLGLWEEGRISGEMHLGTGEEAVAAGLSAHLRDGDALALDHRPTPFMLLRGVDPVAMVREMLGREDGLCRGRGGHMHLFSKAHRAASSGIVGAAAPTGAGFALAAQRLRPGSVALALFGEGAMNQGMVMETLNLAVVWRLPLLFVCKDNGWAITTDSSKVTAGDVQERAAAFGLPTVATDGLDPVAVYEAAGAAVERARSGQGPTFLLARCARLDSHMAGFVMDRVANRPISEGGAVLRQVAGAALARGGARFAERLASLGSVTERLLHSRAEHRQSATDPLRQARRRWKDRAGELDAIDAEVVEEIAAIRAEALAGEAEQ
ncbi:MAG: thiamine pyrophosphate-dependent dehydrogenase E1 component subunit alpha [Gemmatimonadota bacterium]